MATLEKRVEALEQAAGTADALVTVLIEPGPDASAETIGKYLDQLAQAKMVQGKVIVVQFVDAGHPEQRESLYGVTYVRHEWEAQMLLLAGETSKLGNANRLADLLNGLNGNTLGVRNDEPNMA